jgi:hypothetical protein
MIRWFAVLLLVVVLSSFGVAINTGLIASYNLNRNTGKINKDNNFGNDGTIIGDGYFKNNFYYFDGSGDGVTTPFNLRYNITNKFTFIFWAKPDNLSAATFKTIFGRQNSLANNSVWAITWELTNDSYSLYTSAVTGTNPYASSHMAITDTKWHQICYTYDGITLKGYIDGIIKINTTITFSLASSTKVVSFGIGDSGLTATTSFLGYLNMGNMYNRPLLHQEILNKYIDEKKSHIN